MTMTTSKQNVIKYERRRSLAFQNWKQTIQKKTLLSLAVVKVHLTESLERTESDIREICYQDKIFLHKKKPPPTSYSYMANQGYKICIIIDKICVCRGLNASGRNLWPLPQWTFLEEWQSSRIGTLENMLLRDGYKDKFIILVVYMCMTQ